MVGLGGGDSKDCPPSQAIEIGRQSDPAPSSAAVVSGRRRTRRGTQRYVRWGSNFKSPTVGIPLVFNFHWNASALPFSAVVSFFPSGVGRSVILLTPP